MTRACPLCRATTHFVTPSHHWVTDPEEKAEVIAEYQRKLSNKVCRYYHEGRGQCPFGSSCFYVSLLLFMLIKSSNNSFSSVRHTLMRMAAGKKHKFASIQMEMLKRNQWTRFASATFSILNLNAGICFETYTMKRK